MKRFFTETALFLVLVFLCPACTQPSRRHVNAVLDDVESYINDRPDSALAVLEGVDTTALTTRALRARYSLLRVMALDKCYEDITVPGLLDPVISWYEHHGSADDKMKTLYFQGRIAQSGGDQKKAAVFYSRAEEYASVVSDKHMLGILYLAEATMFDAVHNTEKEVEYTEKGIAVFRGINDPMQEMVLGQLAISYAMLKKWEQADSLFRKGISASSSNSFAMSVLLSNYARMKVLQPDPDPEAALESLDRMRNEYGYPLSLRDAGAYAYALALSGRSREAEGILDQLEQYASSSPLEVEPWLSRCASAVGDYKRAYGSLSRAHAAEESVIQNVLSDSVTKALQDYYEVSARQERERRLRQGVWTLAGVSLLLFIAILLLLRERRVRVERDRLLRIRAELEQDLKEQEARTSMLSDSFSSRLAQLRLQLKIERLERLRKSGQYGYWIWMEKKGRSSDANVTKALRKDLQDICALEKDSRLLECRLDKELDGIVSHLKADLNIANRPKEVFFLCCWLIGLKPDMIAELLNLQMSNVYVKTHRLEERIRRLGKAEYAPLVKE